MNKIKYIVLHHTAVSRGTQRAQFYPVNRYHKEKFDMKSSLGWYIGYTYFIGTNGAVTQTRAHGEETAAVLKHNKDSIHICIAGDFNNEYTTSKQEKNLIELVRKLQKEYPDAELKLHNELDKNRTCPGANLSRVYIDWMLPKIDKVDSEKQEKIESLKKQLDILMEMLHNLLAKLRLK